MKAKLFSLPLVLLIGYKSFSQAPVRGPIKMVPAMKKDSVAPVLVAKTVIGQPKLVSASSVNTKPQSEAAVTKNPDLASARIVNAKPNSEVSVTKNPNLTTAKPTLNPTTVPPQPAPTNLNAKLIDAFVTVNTGYGPVSVLSSPDYGKDKDTHWSCGIFDQNGRPVTSFHDDSNTDEYPQGSTKGPLQMHIDNAAVLGDFASNGHIHINIAPNGNDTWVLSSFTLEIDFQNPSSSQKLTWSNITMSQDSRDVDLYFLWNGKNLVTRQ